MKAFDFFCGAGGLTRGLLDAGIEVVAGFDCDERCRYTYEHNNPGVRFVEADIRKININDLMTKGRMRKYDNVLFAGCAPCQPFSSQRKGNERRHDATLLGEFGRLVEAALPGYVLIENVPGIARVRGFSTFRRFLRMLEANDYLFVYDILNAKRYGVPQNRRRLVLLAGRHLRPSLPEPSRRMSSPHPKPCCRVHFRTEPRTSPPYAARWRRPKVVAETFEVGMPQGQL